MNIAVVGAGHLGTIHARLWNANTNAVLTAIVEPNQEQGERIAADNNTRWFATIADLHASGISIDAVTIASPTVTHYSAAVECLRYGWHCFIEKPVTANHIEAQQMLDMAQAADKVIQVGHVERFNPAIKALESFPVQPVFIEAHRLASFKPRAIDVSVIHDLMIHDIDLIMWLTKSEVVDVQATGVTVLTETPDICNARLTFANGCVANLTASRISAKPMRKMRVFQKDSYISLDLAAPSLELYRLIETSALDASHQVPLGTVSTQYGDRTIVFDTPVVPAHNAIAEEQNAFLSSITSGTPAAVTLREGAEAVRIAEIIERKISEGNVS